MKSKGLKCLATFLEFNMVDFSVLKVAESEVIERKTWHLQDVGEVLSSSLISILDGSMGLSCPYFSPWAIHLFKRFIEAK